MIEIALRRRIGDALRFFLPRVLLSGSMAVHAGGDGLRPDTVVVDGSDRTLADVGFTPVFRFDSDSRSRTGWFADAGVGPNLLSRLYENHKRNFSTAFQFGDLIGVGYQSAHWMAGIMLEHFSNASIKHPNPGANFALCTIGYRFD